jgi:outer membrane protein
MLKARGSGPGITGFFAATGFCAALAAAQAFPQAAQAQTLLEALADAYTNNPTLRASRAELRSVNEGVPQALSNWRPTVTVTADAGLQSSEIDNDDGRGSNTDS